MKWLTMWFNGGIWYYWCYNTGELHYKQYASQLCVTEAIQLFPCNTHFVCISNGVKVNTLTNTHSSYYSTASK